MIPILAALGAAQLFSCCIIDDMRISSCDEGHCTQVCGIGDLCTFSCDGGGCDQICKAHSECVLSCDGGDCDQTCLPGANVGSVRAHSEFGRTGTPADRV